MFEAMSDDPDFEYLIVNSTIVRAHQRAGAKKGGLGMRRSAARAAAWHQDPYGRIGMDDLYGSGFPRSKGGLRRIAHLIAGFLRDRQDDPKP